MWLKGNKFHETPCNTRGRAWQEAAPAWVAAPDCQGLPPNFKHQFKALNVEKMCSIFTNSFQRTKCTCLLFEEKLMIKNNWKNQWILVSLLVAASAYLMAAPAFVFHEWWSRRQRFDQSKFVTSWCCLGVTITRHRRFLSNEHQQCIQYRPIPGVSLCFSTNITVLHRRARLYFMSRN